MASLGPAWAKVEAGVRLRLTNRLTYPQMNIYNWNKNRRKKCAHGILKSIQIDLDFRIITHISSNIICLMSFYIFKLKFIFHINRQLLYKFIHSNPSYNQIAKMCTRWIRMFLYNSGISNTYVEKKTLIFSQTNFIYTHTQHWLKKKAWTVNVWNFRAT